MAEEQPSLHIDTDWKKQAQEEKRRLAERAQRDREQRPPTPPPGLLTTGAGAGPAAPVAAPAAAADAVAGTATGAAGRRGERELPPANFPALVHSLMTQALLYMGEIATQSGPMLNLDMARRQIDLLTMLEEKTQNNLTDEERQVLDLALHELRTRFVSVASQFL